MEDLNATWRTRFKRRGGHLADRAQDLHDRYRRLVWTVHSIWALLTGVAVLVLAHNRYGFLPWVTFFLALTWLSTLFFSRVAGPASSRVMRFAQGFVSYLTRIMYQETLFFLLPFYFYSTTFPSPNSAFVVVLAVLAVLSCFDLVFDRLLRTSRPFALGFFAIVTFSALQFFFPVLLGVKVHLSTYLAAALSFLAAAPLAYPWKEIRPPRRLAALALALLLSVGVVRLLRPAVPPVPLRLSKLRFATSFDTRTLSSPQEYDDVIPLSALRGQRLVAVATIFAPEELRASITIRFLRDGRQLRTSRTLDLVAHSRGFRVWDTLSSQRHTFTPGAYRVEVWTAEGQLVGRDTIKVVADAVPPGPPG